MIWHACLAAALALCPRGSIDAVEILATLRPLAFPTAVGTAWRYRLSNDTDGEFRIASARRDGDVTVVEIDSVGLPGDRLQPAGGRQASGRLEVSASGVVEAREFPGNSARTPPVPLLRLPFADCDAWSADGDAPLLGGWVDPGGQRPERYRYEFAATGWEWVTVPAGRFLALRVESVATRPGGSTFPQVRWFCPGVGIVRWERGTGRRGPSVWELTEFRPGAPPPLRPRK